MRVALLYSGGRDSSLAAYLLENLGYSVELVNVNFGVLDSHQAAERAAESLGMEHRVVTPDFDILEETSRVIAEDGFPGRGISYLHLQALEKLAHSYPALGDGTRRDDRSPRLSLREIRSLEDKFGIEYLAPLRGLGYKTINRLADETFDYQKGLSEYLHKSDYESEIRELMTRKGLDVRGIFPREHSQSIVKGYKK